MVVDIKERTDRIRARLFHGGRGAAQPPQLDIGYSTDGLRIGCMFVPCRCRDADAGARCRVPVHARDTPLVRTEIMYRTTYHVLLYSKVMLRISSFCLCRRVV